MTVERGAIYWVEFEPVKGSEQGGLRPALVVQNNVGNRNSPTTIVVAITSRITPRSYPFAVTINPAESGLPQPSTVNCAQIATVQQAGPQSRFRPPPGESDVRQIGQLSRGKLAEVDRSLKSSLGLK